jgi:DNA-binding GntR family transcriptional regulator
MQNVLIEGALTIDNATLTLADRVFSQIQDAIVKGELLAGAKISEAELTSSLWCI